MTLRYSEEYQDNKAVKSASKKYNVPREEIARYKTPTESGAGHPFRSVQRVHSLPDSTAMEPRHASSIWIK